MVSPHQLNHHHHYCVTLFIIATCVYTATAAILPSNVNVALIDDDQFYSALPNEIVPIQPLLVYPKSRNALPYQGRNLLKDNDIIYVKLLDRKSYRPRKQQQQLEGGAHELEMKDIFYVKAVANGQFSTNRLKVYRLPEFYAINVYKKSDLLK